MYRRLINMESAYKMYIRETDNAEDNQASNNGSIPRRSISEDREVGKSAG